MRKTSTLFLRFVICLIAILTFTGLIWFPQTEGRAANLDLVSIYTDPFIIYVYIASIPLFVAFYQAFKILNLIDKNKIFSHAAILAVRNIKNSAFVIIGFLVLAISYIRVMVHSDDPAGPTMMGIVAVFTSLVIATAAAILQKLLQNAVDIKSENDLTV